MPPTITVAIPLHGSARWVENVVSNVRALPPTVTEILISDQTCIDDAAEQLGARLADDPRVVIHAAPAGLYFAEHYQLLVESGSGELFMWMPHDDIFAPDWVPILAEALAAHPTAWLAFGQVRDVEVDGATPITGRCFPFVPGVISGWTAVRLMVRGCAWVPFRGLFRRRDILAAGIRMTPETSVMPVDMEWSFAVALRSGLVYDDRAVTWKRWYADSTHNSARWRSQRRGNAVQAAVALLHQYGPRGMTGIAMRAGAHMMATAPLRRARDRLITRR